MTKKQLFASIADLERRIAALETRPAQIVYIPVYSPPVPTWPYTAPITYGSGMAAVPAGVDELPPTWRYSVPPFNMTITGYAS